MAAPDIFWNIYSCSVFILVSCISAIKIIKNTACCSVCHLPVNKSEPLYYRMLLSKSKRSAKQDGFTGGARQNIGTIRLSTFHELMTQRHSHK